MKNIIIVCFLACSAIACSDQEGAAHEDNLAPYQLLKDIDSKHHDYISDSIITKNTRPNYEYNLLTNPSAPLTNVDHYVNSLHIKNQSSLHVNYSMFGSSVRFTPAADLYVEPSYFCEDVLLSGRNSKPSNSKATFRSCVFEKKVVLQDWESINNTDIKFEHCTFLVPLRYRNPLDPSQLSEPKKQSINVTFLSSKFEANMDLDAQPNVQFDFSYCELNFPTLGFYNSSLKSPPTFVETTLPQMIYFFENHTSDWAQPLDLRKTIIPESSGKKIFEKCVLYFDCYNHRSFESLDGSKYIVPSDKFQLEFGSDIPYSTRMRFVKQLLDNCHAAGMYDSERDWTILAKKLENINDWGALGVLMNWAIDGFWGFGYRQWQIVIIWMPLSFMLFWAYAFARLRYIIENVYFDQELGKNYLNINVDSENVSKAQARSEAVKTIMSHQITYSFFMTAVIYFGFKIRHEAVNYKNGKGMFYVYLLYLMGTFHVAYTIGYLLR